MISDGTATVRDPTISATAEEQTQATAAAAATTQLAATGSGTATNDPKHDMDG